MKFAIVFTLLLHQREPDRWFGADKVKHFAAAAFVQSASFSALRATGLRYGPALAGASAATAAASLGKEMSDRRRGKGFSPRDLAWDAAGAGASTLLLSHTIR